MKRNKKKLTKRQKQAIKELVKIFFGITILLIEFVVITGMIYWISPNVL